MGFWDSLNNIGNSLGTNKTSGYEKWSTNVISDGRRSYTGYLLQPLDVSASILFANIGSRGLNIRGKSIQSDENDKLYPAGFTPELDYYINTNNIDTGKWKDLGVTTGYPVERGLVLRGGIIKDETTLAGTPLDQNNYLDKTNGIVVKAYEAFDDLPEYKFRHNLDPDKILVNLGDIYLTSNRITNFDNEDPVSFGYDIKINFATSPLFNGGIENFINTFSSYSEINSRLDILSQFKRQFFKFFKIDSISSVKDNNGDNIIEDKYVTRTYYLKKISGLDGLSESINSDKSKQFVEYGNDYLILTLNEDVTINMGYLASLYKILTWSKINGKKMFPDNLLRFDMEIIVTESRNYNKVKTNDDLTAFNQFANIISKYRYKVYECQFFFEKMSHDDSIDMSSLDISQGFDIKINYKFSTLHFEWLNQIDSNPNLNIHESNKSYLNNGAFYNSDGYRSYDLSKYSLDTNNSNIDNNSITTNPISYTLNEYGFPYTADPKVQANNVADSALNSGNNSVKVTDNYATRLNNYFPPKSNNNSVSLRDELIQQTVDNISNQFGSIGSMIFSSAISGFTEDGYEYNIPAYYLNKTLNPGNNSLTSAFGMSKP